MAAPIRILVLSTSHRGDSRSERLAVRCTEVLQEAGVEVAMASLKDHEFPPLKVSAVSESESYKRLCPMVAEADGLVLASPVYNWSLSAALKQFIEHIGSVDSEFGGAFFDKVVTFVGAAGLPHGYMAAGPTALSLMFDFKCIVNPYQVYVYDDCWDQETLLDTSDQRLRKSMSVMVELTTLLRGRTYKSDWCV